MRIGFWKRLRIRLTPVHMLPRLGGFARTIYLNEHNRNVTMMHPTARRKAIVKYGKAFIELFPTTTVKTEKVEFHIEPIATAGESPIGIGILQNARDGKGEILGELKIGFAKKEVIIEAIQGTKPNDNKFVISNKELMQAFKAATGSAWAPFLIAQIEGHAIALGFKRVKIIKPEANSYFHIHARGQNGKPIPQPVEVQQRMKALYYGVARKMHYRAEGNYLVKEL